MSKLTNRLGLPDALVRAIQNDPYDKGNADYSVTELLKPPRVRALTEKYKDQIEEDVEDSLYRLYGQLVHALLERANVKDLAEKRMFGKFSGKVLSGGFDNLTLDGEGILTDYKFTTVWKFKKDKGEDPEYAAQLNMLAALLMLNGYTVKKLQIVGLLRDFSQSEKNQSFNYPDNPIAIMPITMWPREKTTAFIEMRIAAHESAKQELPECTSDERWAKPDVYAVVKGQRAISGGVQFSLEAAEKLKAENPGTRIEFRPGISVRCQNYCSISKWCDQYQKTLKKDEAV